MHVTVVSCLQAMAARWEKEGGAFSLTHTWMMTPPNFTTTLPLMGGLFFPIGVGMADVILLVPACLRFLALFRAGGGMGTRWHEGGTRGAFSRVRVSVFASPRLEVAHAAL